MPCFKSQILKQRLVIANDALFQKIDSEKETSNCDCNIYLFLVQIIIVRSVKSHYFSGICTIKRSEFL